MKCSNAFLLIVFSVPMLLFAAKDPFKTFINLNEADSNRLKIRIETPKIDLPKVRFVIPSNIPGCISEVKSGKLFSDIRAFDIDNKEIPVKRLSINEFEIYPSKKLAAIEYDVHDSWHFKERNVLIPQLGTSFIAGKQFLLNFHAMVGYLEGFEGYVQKLEIRKPISLNGYSGINLSTFSNVDYAECPNYLALIDNPILYTTQKEQGFIVGKVHYHVCTYSENDSVKPGDILKTIKAVSEGVDEFCNGLNVKDYYFLINYVNPATNAIASEEDFGAVQHSTSSVFFFPENVNRYKLLRDIQFTSAHELFHLFEPLSMKTDVTSKLNMRAKLPTSNLWLYEGCTEYLSLLMQFQKELISEQEFITEVRNKMNLAEFYEPYSLTDQSERCYLEGNEKSYRNFYFKGATTAMMLDLQLLKLSKGEMNLKSLLTDIKDYTKTNYVVKDEYVIPEVVKYSYPEIQNFFDDYVKGTKKIDYNDFLSVIGWKYEPQRSDTSKLFANASYRYTKASKEFYATNVSLDQIGLRDGDVLVSINKKRVTKENIESLMEKYSARNYNRKVVFEIRRGTDLIELTGSPLVVTKNQKNFIAVEKKVETEKKTYRKTFSSGKLHKNSAYKL
ncbi:MAG: hypothetical protein U0T73_11980 [Chitinophagales bacterium]